MVIGPAGSRAMVRARPVHADCTCVHYLYLKHAFTSCRTNIHILNYPPPPPYGTLILRLDVAHLPVVHSCDPVVIVLHIHTVKP